ncbi:hypothetical protein SERLA73DRAFT_174849 [Serpula lacrymans var. lacrymans S7.3]|uniref:Uncharacterized protein n=2 Tax=Serpula lacrymans var. lacrymans TaxID=341189 RepID=F8PIL1_SERL3|nr:uncharacterized protein SERLADRAFT_456532 [Serpula lacrymans var. lacrymans S7.9]EGO03382.1 hypothetical protein SERLA73DRAFT_174849 [Serpula lacrymans var. lacrymans S7.3]EGO29153.1 hypothetical protein SERLADRAFT_456532 [Serpula lacrymans var. lacrymans S7.9]
MEISASPPDGTGTPLRLLLKSTHLHGCLERAARLSRAGVECPFQAGSRSLQGHGGGPPPLVIKLCFPCTANLKSFTSGVETIIDNLDDRWDGWQRRLPAVNRDAVKRTY